MSFLIHKGLVKLIFTQNIDGLELKANIPRDKIIFAHGNTLEGHCPKCLKDVNMTELSEHIKEGKIMHCPICKFPCKPKVVFYGESLPPEFLTGIQKLAESDLGIVMGTSLKVAPFNVLPHMLKPNSWRVLVNREEVGVTTGQDTFHFDDVTSNDVFIAGTTDEIVLRILKDCGWEQEFEEYVAKIKQI